jgi:hypothetical protein
VLFAAGLLVYEQSLVKPDDLSRVNLAFFTLNGFVSIGVFLFLLVDWVVRGWSFAFWKPVAKLLWVGWFAMLFWVCGEIPSCAPRKVLMRQDGWRVYGWIVRKN